MRWEYSFCVFMIDSSFFLFLRLLEYCEFCQRSLFVNYFAQVLFICIRNLMYMYVENWVATRENVYYTILLLLLLYIAIIIIAPISIHVVRRK